MIISGNGVTPHHLLETSRGCPFTCTYCEEAFCRGEHRTAHSVGRVFEVQSDVVAGDVARYESLIASSSTSFAPFYHVPHPDFEKKRQMIEALGFSE